MALETYRQKRDFQKTSEPPGVVRKGSAAAGGGRFVVQKHAATRLHYDFRLEHDGVLWSWAVTRGPSLDPAEKRLAVHVEDHPLDYAGFEGTIPQGQYGAGSVIVWDEGSWVPEIDPDKGMAKGHLRFALKGSKLNGSWNLVRLKPRPGEKRDNWLLIKSNDSFARPGEDILAEAPESVKSGRAIEEIGEGNAPTWHSNKAAKGSGAAGRKMKAAPAAKALAFMPPCLARLVEAAPDGHDWVHEVKFDGYRIQAHKQADGSVRLYTRTGLDWTGKFGTAITQAIAALPCDSAVLDGEVVVLTDKGVASFSALQQALSEGRAGDMIYYVFDFLHRDGEDIRGETLTERKAQLRELLGEDQQGPLRYSEHFAEPGRTMLSHACRLGLEGVVSKRVDAAYHSGRGHDWVKSKCTMRQEFVIAGYIPSQARGRGLRSLVVGYNKDGALVAAGHVGTGFTSQSDAELMRRLAPLATKGSPYHGAAARERGVVWVKPEMVAEIEFRSWTHGGNLRHASFQGLREDKPAGEVVAEIPEAGETSEEAPAKAAPGAARKGTASVTLTRPDKLLWPKAGLTKAGLLEHYERVWPRMAHYVVDRPLSLVRMPDGVDGKQRFFQKHASAGMPDVIRTMKDPQDGEELLFISDIDGMAALVQLGVVELHIWGATTAEPGKPDQVVFDLDPDEGLGADDVRKAAIEVRERLAEVGFASLVKTSGGKGFHIVVPLQPAEDWATVKTFAHDFAQAMAQSAPERYTATLSKKARHGRIFIDYLRNGRGATTVAPYSTRAKPDATISMPISWKQLEDGAGPADFTADAKAVARAMKAADPWADYEKLRRPLRG